MLIVAISETSLSHEFVSKLSSHNNHPGHGMAKFETGPMGFQKD